MLNRQRRPFVVPHFDKLRWLIQERRLVDFRGMASLHMGNHPMLNLIQILTPIQVCDVLVYCKEDTMGILKHLMIWKPNWITSKDLLRRLGWSMIDAAMMNPNQVEVPIGQSVQMNILMWNYRGALNPDFKRKIFEMAVNHHPSIMVITETRVGGERAERIIEGLPFDGFITTDTIGYSRGLWILWKKEEAEVLPLASTEQEIHATVKVRSTNLSWLITAIYASPRLAERKILWSNIVKVSQLHNLPWLMVGDFNEVLCGEDKFGGSQINLNRAMDFKACLDTCRFVDLGFAGPKYTWSNKRQITDLILERIDRCFANSLWRILYPEAIVTHLPRTFSDHHPVLIELSRPNPNHLSKPFWFQTMWITHPNFPRIVREAWLGDNSLSMSILNFTTKARKWNHEVFGNLFVRKRRVPARIGGA